MSAADVPTEWRDVSDALRDAAAELALGELLHNDDFALQRTMTAVVVGSDRMDTNSREEVEDPYQLAAADIAAVPNFTPEEKLGIMDRLFSLQASYHEGTGLGSSVYTCVMLFDMDKLKEADALLFEFCSLLTISCATVRDLLLDARVCEDEDFNILTHGLPMVSTTNPVDNVDTVAEQKLADTHNELPGPLVRALLARLRFQRYLLLGIRAVLVKSKQLLLHGARYFTNAEAELKTIISTAHLKTAAPCGFHDRLSTAGQHMRFSKILSEEETWTHFERLLEELKASTSIVNVSSYKEMTSFLHRFSRRSPGPIARSCLYLQLDDRKQKANRVFPKWVPSKRMLTDAIGMPPAQVDNMGKDADYFLEQALIGVQNFICCMCLNNFRQRRRLKRSLEDWHHLHDHAISVDGAEEFTEFLKANEIKWPPNSTQGHQATSSNPGPFTVWVEKETCHVLLHHLLLGFEQSLYQENEFLSIYWYCDYLLARMIVCTRELFSVRSATSGSPSNKKQAKAQQQQAEIIRAQKHAAEVALLELERSLCQGLTRLLLGLKMAGIVTVPPLPFNEEQNRFEQRFLPFWTLERPEPLDFHTYYESITSGQTDQSRLLRVAARFFGLAEEHITMIKTRSSSSAVPEDIFERVDQMQKVAKTNVLAAKVLEKMLTSGAQVNIRFNFEVDRHYPSIAISR